MTTWHPMGRSWRSSVRIEQRVNGQPTGLWFDISRQKWWLLKALAIAIRWNLPLANRLWDHIIVQYSCWISNRGQA